MDLPDLSVLPSVRVTLPYMTPTTGTPYLYACEPPPGVPPQGNWVTDEVSDIPVYDARQIANSLSVDVQGFQLERWPTQVRDFYDGDEVRRVYYPETVEYLKRLTGAEKVVVFDHAVRSKAPDRAGQAMGTIRQAHNDYTELSGRRRVSDTLPPEESEFRLAGRCLELNVWRPIAGPLEDEPLAICDARSIAPSDLIRTVLYNSGDRIGESYSLAHNPDHRWFYVRRMERDEVLVFKCYDSATDGRARLGAHTAFVDPTTPPGARPRESIELRALLFMPQSG